MKHFRLLAILLLSSNLHAVETPAEPQHVVYMGDNGVVVLSFQIGVGGTSPQQSFETYVDDLMASLDTNHDGVVSAVEANGKYLSARDASQAELTPRTTVVKPNLSPDVDPADGKISRQEFLTYFKRIGIQPFIITFQPRLTPNGGNRRPRQATNLPDVPLFTRLDVNGDGKLSAEELAGALQTLRKQDLDDDEIMSEMELNPVSNTNFVAQQQQPSTTPAASTSPFLGLGSDETLSKQIRRLIEKYDSSDPAKSGVESSTLRNQKLSPREIGISSESFARFDGDGDGQLDFDELKKFLSSPESTITITVNVDVADPLRAESILSEIEERLRTTPDGATNVNFGTTQLSLSRGLSGESGTAESFLKPQFIQADTDANGYLEKAEFERAFFFGVTFENLDTDKNGKVFLDEAVAFFKIRFDAARARTVLAIDEQGRTLFEILDTDRDRRLSFRELQLAAGKLALWDKDGDGLLSESEIPMQYRLVVSRGSLPAMSNLFGGVSGSNQQGASDDRSIGPIWFRKMDKNRDGEVSRREFLGDIGTFEFLDKNHDGFLDLTEAITVESEHSNR